MDELGGFGKALGTWIAKELARELRAANSDGWIPQDKSDLGPRVHCRAVRRRMKEGRLDATIVRRDGRRVYLMSPEALQEEMVGRRTPTVKAIPVDGDGAVIPIEERVRKMLGGR